MIKIKELKKLQFVVQIFLFLEIIYLKMYLSLWINLRVKQKIGETILKMLSILRCLILFSLKIKEFSLKQLHRIQSRKVTEKQKIKIEITIAFNLNIQITEKWTRDRKIICLIKRIVVKIQCILCNLNHHYKIVHTYRNHHLLAEGIQSKKNKYKMKTKERSNRKRA